MLDWDTNDYKYRAIVCHSDHQASLGILTSRCYDFHGTQRFRTQSHLAQVLCVWLTKDFEV